MNNFINALDKVIGLIEKICMAGSVLSVVLMMLLVTADVTGRKLFNHPIPGSVEINEEYLMVSIVYLSMSYVYVQGGHVRVTLFRRFLPGPFLKLIDPCLNIFGLFFFSLITFFGWEKTLTAMQFGETSSCILAYPLAPAYFLLTLGAALLCLRIAESIFLPAKIKWEEH
ncbi:TRAP transporter small permease [Desulfofundulus thermosubterraneus]|uniref:TRAP-type C4-dicarboxylate transport system, small permease component n=1 Tax=Desulfofundulus thermosubterraneus DSM 16057 TaxID=1121432 RepID=A0A1M6M8A5_9FIRM|nr:TRAP transporter small permease [Desulfofundulus thermosubterraneus]SHJ79686.1 TRAP-type C4-dicarboxylate transport system, small permease component [Desulfofundulus thermosubterraneus DSM 16057]